MLFGPSGNGPAQADGLESHSPPSVHRIMPGEIISKITRSNTTKRSQPQPDADPVPTHRADVPEPARQLGSRAARPYVFAAKSSGQPGNRSQPSLSRDQRRPRRESSCQRRLELSQAELAGSDDVAHMRHHATLSVAGDDHDHPRCAGASPIGHLRPTGLTLSRQRAPVVLDLDDSAQPGRIAAAHAGECAMAPAKRGRGMNAEGARGASHA